MPGADNLKEEIGALGAEGKIADFVNDQKIRRLIITKFFEERTIDIGRGEEIDHIHGAGEEGFDAVLGGGKSDGFGQEAFPYSGIPDEQDIFFGGYKGHIHQVEDPGFLFLPGDVEVKVELINGWFFKEP